MFLPFTENGRASRQPGSSIIIIILFIICIILVHNKNQEKKREGIFFTCNCKENMTDLSILSF